MANKKYTPSFVGTITKYLFVESRDITPQHLSIRAYEISQGVMIKETCFGLQITGKPDEVESIITELRKTDPAHILVKDRGFPPGDKRRCRANLGGARPGYFGHEFEMRLLKYISAGLIASSEGKKASKETCEKIRSRPMKRLDADKLSEIIKNSDSLKENTE